MIYKREPDVKLFIDAILEYEKNNLKLRGLDSREKYITLSKQMVDSVRRIEYINAIGRRDISQLRIEPNSELFDPLKAAWLYKLENNIDEACWLIFLATHFGKSLKSNWRLCANIYGGLGRNTWTWQRIVSDFSNFDIWFRDVSLKISNGLYIGNFGNHRKYESLDYYSNRPLQKIIRSYIDWVGNAHQHQTKFYEISTILSGLDLLNESNLFDYLYKSMNSVLSFGRTARFDYLTMLYKFSILNAIPNNSYLVGATGPRFGAKLLFYGDIGNHCNIQELNDKISGFVFQMPIQRLHFQVIEDALCNWQKSPSIYQYFGG